MQDFSFNGICNFIHLISSINCFSLMHVYFTDEPLITALLLALQAAV